MRSGTVLSNNYWFKYATTGIVDLVRISGHAYKKPEEIGHACLENRVDVFSSEERVDVVC